VPAVSARREISKPNTRHPSCSPAINWLPLPENGFVAEGTARRVLAHRNAKHPGAPFRARCD